jgi:hypothetical protein
VDGDKRSITTESKYALVEVVGRPLLVAAHVAPESRLTKTPEPAEVR